MNGIQMKIRLFDRICLAIPFLRHRMAKNTMAKNTKELKLLNIVNRSFSHMIASNIVTLYNEGKLEESVFCDLEYHKQMVVKMFGNKAKKYVEQIKCEKAIIKASRNMKIFLFYIPSNKEVGQNDIVAYVLNSISQAFYYSWEWSVNHTRMICSWEKDTHLNYGGCDNKIEFVKRIASLSKEDTCVNKDNDTQRFEEIDLKHRLAKEIGVRYENLDFYMTTFQKMVQDGMNGVISSDIPLGIEDADEWMRYLTWEINQAKQRMSPDDLEQSKKLFEDMINNQSSKSKWN